MKAAFYSIIQNEYVILYKRVNRISKVVKSTRGYRG